MLLATTLKIKFIKPQKMTSTIQTVNGTEIKSLKFPKEDVLNNKEDKICRFVELHKAMYLTGLKSDKAEIVFSDDSTNLKKIAAKIKAVTQKEVVLKNSIIIPLVRIVSVA